MKRTACLSMICLALLTACAETKPIVSDYNGASVKIQTDMFTPNAGESTQAEANRICATNRKRAEYASSRALPEYTYEHLYLCL